MHHQTTAVTGASQRRCGTTAGYVMLTNTFLRSLFVVSVGIPGRLSLHRVTVHFSRGLRCWQGRFLHLFCIAAVLFPQSGTFFNTHLPLMSLPIMRCVTCSRSGSRRCAWTWLVQRNVIHDTIKLLNGDAGFGQALSPVLARHTLSFFLWTRFDVLSQPRGYYDAFATARAGCSAGGVAAPTGRHFPGRVLLRLPRHHQVAERRCSLAIIAAGLGSGSKLTRHVVVSDFLSLCLSQ